MAYIKSKAFPVSWKCRDTPQHTENDTGNNSAIVWPLFIETPIKILYFLFYLTAQILQWLGKYYSGLEFSIKWWNI